MLHLRHLASRRSLLALLLILVCSLGVQARRRPLPVNYATFNIRYGDGDKKDAAKCWNARRDRVAEFISSQQLDIVGLQEVLSYQVRDLEERLPDYAYEGVHRDDGKLKGEASPIFWKKDLWERQDGGTFWLSETPDVAGSMGWDAACVRIATWVLLKHHRSGRQVICVNTHFDHVGTKARIESGRLIMRKVSEIADGRDIPLILTGDFNVNASSQTYYTITHNPDFPLLDTFLMGAPHEGPWYSFHGFSSIKPERAEKIDFIFASPGVRVSSTFIPTEDRSSKPQHLSDHSPVVAHLLL